MDIKKLKPIAINFLILLVLIWIFRVSFAVYNHSLFNLGFKDYLLSFLYGIRFDLAGLAIVFSPYLLSLFFPWGMFHKVIYMITTSVTLYFSVVDVEYYQFVGKRIQVSLLGEFEDFVSQSLQITLYYWPITLVFFVILFAIGRLYRPVSLEFKTRFGSLLFLIILNFILIRGGLQLKSISPQTAFVNGNFELGIVTLNPVYTFFRTLNDKSLEKVSYFAQDDIAIKNLKQDTKTLLIEKYPKQNIVILIMESFAMEYLDYAPFVKSLQDKALYFEKGMANGRRSMEAMPSIFQSFPSILDEPLYKSSYQTNSFESLPLTLKKEGYFSAFFHGGKLGTMGFDSYALSIGFDRYYSMDDYPESSHYDGNWGIFDHYFFKFFSKELATFKEPFLAALFSLSTHHPYTIPDEFQNQFPKGELPIHETIGYGDYVLRDFFEFARKQPWYKNTLFVITADHSQKRVTKKYQNVVGEYRVPIIFYHPEINLKKYQQDKIVSQVDIYPSILDFLDIKPLKKNLYGQSAFKQGPGSAFFKSGESFMLLRKDTLTTKSISGKATTKSYDFSSGELTDRPNREDDLLLLKSYIQYTNNGLRNDSLYLPK